MYPYYRDKTGCYIRLVEFENMRWVLWPDGKKRCQFTHKNLKKQNMIRLGNLWSANKLPDEIKHYKIQANGYVKVPSGIAWFTTYPFIHNYASEVISHPSLTRASYDYQVTSIWELTTGYVWLLHASTGSWKTQVICDLTQRHNRKTLILVQNLGQMAQMVADILDVLGVIPTQVSGKKPSKKEQATWYDGITVCSIDSRDKINSQDYWLILLDEADTYLGSDDRREWIGSLSPEFMYTLTWTVKINHVDDDVFRLYYGPKTELKMLHHTPDYKQVYSNFEYFLDNIKDFHELKAALYSAEDRNKLIVDTTLANMKGRKVIVFTEHIAHANTLSDMFKSYGKVVYTLIGEVPKDERERIRQAAKDAEGEVIIVGSVKILGRGFDLPELSLGVLTTCEKFTSSISQYMGRIVRAHLWKPKPIFIDIVDHLTPILMNQARSRVSTYKKTFPGWKITTK